MKSLQKILVNRDGLDDSAVKLLKDNNFGIVFAPLYATEHELIDIANNNQTVAIILSQAKVTKKVLESCASVKVIVKHGSGVNNINLQAAEALNIPVYRALGANAQSVAEHAMAMIFALRKSLVCLDNSMRQGKWLKGKFQIADIQGATLGLIGLGEIGHRVANMAVALGMKVIAFDPATSEEPAGIKLMSSPQALSTKADVISLHCPLTPKTRHLIDAEFLANMPSHAAIVNTARGGIIDEDALAEALINQQIAGAALDSFESEPPNLASRLWQAPNLLVTPHIAGQTPGAVQAMGVTAAQIIIDYLSGKTVDTKLKAEYSVLGGLTE